MIIQDLITYGKKYLHTNEVNMLLSHILGYDVLEIYLHLNEMVDNAKVNQYQEMIEKIRGHKPIQYVLGNVNFYGFPFQVNENVLIPRFETEELVENTLQYIDKFFNGQNLKVIDLGCGSGNIGITLKKMRNNLDVTCLDISDKALEVAKTNAENLNVNIHFLQGDMLDYVSDKYDVIISNPPYISKYEKIDSIVKDNEPHLALYADNHGLYYYEKILSNCKDKLNQRFLIAFEIGMTQKDEIIKMVYHYLEDVQIESKKDLSNKDRMIFIYKV